MHCGLTIGKEVENMVEKAIIAAAQMNCVLYDVDANLVRAEKLIKKASYKGAKLVALPELFNTGY